MWLANKAIFTRMENPLAQFAIKIASMPIKEADVIWGPDGVVIRPRNDDSSFMPQLAIDIAKMGKNDFNVVFESNCITIRQSGGVEEVAVQPPPAVVPQPQAEPTHFPVQLAMLSQAVQQPDPYEIAARIVAQMMRNGAFPPPVQQYVPYVPAYGYPHTSAAVQQLMASQVAAQIEQVQHVPTAVTTVATTAVPPTAVPPTAAPTAAPTVAHTVQATPTVQTTVETPEQAQPPQKVRWADAVTKDGKKQPQAPKVLPPVGSGEKKKKTRTRVDKNAVAEAVQSNEPIPEGHVGGSCMGGRTLPVCKNYHSKDECCGNVVDDENIRVWNQCVGFGGEPIEGATNPCSGKSVHGNCAGSVPTSANFCRRIDEEGRPADSSIYGCTDPACQFNHVGTFISDKDARADFTMSFYPKDRRNNRNNRNSDERPSRAVNGNGERVRPIRAVDFIKVKVTPEAADDGEDFEPPAVLKKSIDGMPKKE